ncbi:3-oxoacid CoA-transferase [Vagococcus sp. DIV0080]|uniref:3-oxoacid CoA-transferase n=1 Tax=Candidatus Vagococcus giribetii TaxID=2230876 RepID=A0ABS3HS48_9ENTE|nr:CoA-transferase [Vagococcus sp. DIV0080]MBO0476027.1 3-oxoacid CoA-transferase [Vagococcus sp. DIV0080]
MSEKQVTFLTADEAALLIEDGSMLAVGGFIGTGVAEEIHQAVEKRFLETSHPENLGLVYAAGIGDRGARGLNHYGHEGLVKRIIGGHWGLVPSFQPLVENNLVEGYNFPQGVMSQMFRDAAAKRNWHLSKIGLDTFVDPDVDGGKLNDATTEELVKKMTIEDETFLAYKTIYPDVAILKGTYADEKGNISFGDEPLVLEAISMAMATSNNGGKVIVQVKEKCPAGTLDPKSIVIPGVCVDYVVVATDMTNHQQTFDTMYNEQFVSAGIMEQTETTISPLTAKKIIARRAAMFLNPETDHVVNYGIGVPEVVAQVLSEEGQEAYFTPTVEPGIFGGTPQGGLDFGCCVYPEAIIQQGDMFQFYNGGGIDAAFLGMAETDQFGNVNVSKFGPKIAGAGGFIDITQTAKKVIFTGTFTAKGVTYGIDSTGITIETEGSKQKLVDKVEHITFSGAFATRHQQEIYYVTERAVFKLEEAGLTLIEIAPGIDLATDILANMAFKPLISEHLKLMDSSIFSENKMNLNFN